MKNTALMFAGIIFSSVCVLQLVRYFKAWELTIAQHHIPIEWSLYAAIFAGIMAAWMLVAMKK
jgi:hypothetical protein